MNSVFTKRNEVKEEVLMERMLDLCFCANALMGEEAFKTIEMTLNKEDVMLDRSKLIVIKI